MKNNIFGWVIVTTTICVMAVACKKDVRVSDAPILNEEITASLENISSFESNMYVNGYGFLVFTADSSLDSYLNFVQTLTHAEMQRYHDDLEFYSFGSTIYGETYSNEQITEAQAIDYVFNQYKIFQVENVVIKPIGETTNEVKWPFLLAMVPENLSNSSYESLIAGVYDEYTMNKFATNSEADEITLFEFMDEIPNGYEEATANDAEARRPFWGKVTTCTDSQCFNAQTNSYYNCSWVNTVKYVFWIKAWEGRGDDDGWKYGSCSDNGYE